MKIERLQYNILKDRIYQNMNNRTSIYLDIIEIHEKYTTFKMVNSKDGHLKVWVYKLKDDLVFYYFNKQVKLIEPLNII